MRLAVVNLTAGGLSGGYRSYLRHLIPRLGVEPRVSALRVHVPPAGAADLGPGPYEVRAWPTSEVRDPTKWVRRDLDDFAPDIVFVPTARAFRFRSVPTVVMVRNMEPLVCPMRGLPLREAVRNLARREAARRACRGADRVIAVSRFVRDFLVDRWGMPDARVGVVRHGVDQDVGEETLSRPVGVEGLSDRSWLFTAGSLRPARGLEDALGALALLAADGRPVTLAVGGVADPATERFAARLKDQAAAMGLGPYVRWLGRLSAAEMGWCFRRAAAFVMTSRAEACPNTVLEAMGHGAICISTDQPPMPEFFGDAARYYRKGEARSLADAIDAVRSLSIADLSHRREAAVARVRPFRWDRTAAETVVELRRALG